MARYVKPEGPKIWALFSVDNNYDQPDNNLVGWWMEKPPLEVVAQAMRLTFPAAEDEHTVAIVHVWSGKVVRHHETDYRLEHIKEGQL